MFIIELHCLLCFASMMFLLFHLYSPLNGGHLVLPRLSVHTSVNQTVVMAPSIHHSLNFEETSYYCSEPRHLGWVCISVFCSQSQGHHGITTIRKSFSFGLQAFIIVQVWWHLTNGFRISVQYISRNSIFIQCSSVLKFKVTVIVILLKEKTI